MGEHTPHPPRAAEALSISAPIPTVLYALAVAYRDDLASTQERAEQLEADLEDERQRVAELRRAVVSRDTQLAALRQKFNGMPARARIQLGVAIAAAFVVGVLLGALLDLRNTPAQAATPPAKSTTGPEVFEPGIAIAGDGDKIGMKGPTVNDCDCMAGDEACFSACTEDAPRTLAKGGPSASTRAFDSNENKSRLYDRVASGAATESEIRQLKALCMLDGDRACRTAAVHALKALEERKRGTR